MEPLISDMAALHGQRSLLVRDGSLTHLQPGCIYPATAGYVDPAHLRGDRSGRFGAPLLPLPTQVAVLAIALSGGVGHSAPVDFPAIDQSWIRLTDWLARYAPVSYRALHHGASDSEIEQAQAALDIPLPDSLVTLLRLNNGSASADPNPEVQFASRWLPGGNYLLAAEEIPGHVKMLNEILDSLDDETAVGHWWHPAWLPFAADVSANALVIDQRQGDGQGQVGQFDHEGTTTFDWAGSLTEFVATIADAVEQQADFKYFRPTVIEGRLEWEIILG